MMDGFGFIMGRVWDCGLALVKLATPSCKEMDIRFVAPTLFIGVSIRPLLQSDSVLRGQYCEDHPATINATNHTIHCTRRYSNETILFDNSFYAAVDVPPRRTAGRCL